MLRKLPVGSERGGWWGIEGMAGALHVGQEGSNGV
mgnify:FL=1